MERKENNEEQAFLKNLSETEELAKKKLNIYARLLTDAALAKDMEKLACRHDYRKLALAEIMGKKIKKKEGGTQ